MDHRRGTQVTVYITSDWLKLGCQCVRQSPYPQWYVSSPKLFNQMLFQLLIFTCIFSYGLWKIPKCVYSTNVMGFLMYVIFYVYYGLNLIFRYFNPFWIYFLYEVAESESRFMLSTILCYFNKLVKNLTLYNLLELFFMFTTIQKPTIKRGSWS